jgi:acyl-CoA thioesterase I
MSDCPGTPLLIAALGTSLTANGYWLEQLPPALEAALRRGVRATNFGRAGASSRYGVAVAADVAKMRPDILIIEFAINDAALHRGIPLGESAANVVWIIRHLRATSPGSRIYLMTTHGARGLRAILRPRLRRYYDLYRTLAQQERTGLIDGTRGWGALSRKELSRALPDGLHPTPEASAIHTLPCVARALISDLMAEQPYSTRRQ